MENNFEPLYDSREYIHMEEMIQQCAHLALEATKSRLHGGRPLANNAKASPGVILKYMDSYKTSDYATNLPDYYHLRIDKLFRTIAEEKLLRACYNQKHYDLILPVLMFHHILKYEGNKESAISRVNSMRDKANANKDDVQWGKAFLAKPETITIPRLVRNKGNYSKVISATVNTAQEKDLQSNDLIPENVKNAWIGIASLADQYEDIKYCTEYSRAGSFLYDLLSILHNKDNPLDTILRLYMVSELHDVLTNTRYIVRGEAYAQGKIRRPLNQYVYEKRQHNNESLLNSTDLFSEPYPIQYVSNKLEVQQADLAKAKTQRDLFEKLYKHLSEDYKFDTPDILDFFLAKDILDPCIQLDKVFKEYALAIETLLGYVPYLKETAKTANAVIRLVNLFREDKLQESYEKSEDYSIKEDIEYILNFRNLKNDHT